ncbi:hypothetical protein Pyn_07292 [Prunus yedoensis var. nudiflora]|uniref:Uncharacterized protein n=1 Tax=Prunus yedoensis var. nudiflora TaxID=2094558 RepID=A0A314YWW3_PRUYE|nr:hypothetical protein Pyn_07292 [Prunus yedoensis var. nudiflora]
MDAMKIIAVKLRAQTWGLGGGKRGAAAAIGAWVSEGDGSKTGTGVEDDDVTGGGEEETTGMTCMVGKWTGTWVTGEREETQV